MLREDAKSSKIRDYSWSILKDRLQKISIRENLEVIHREVLKNCI